MVRFQVDREIYWSYERQHVLFQSVDRGCVHFSVENSFLKVSRRNVLYDVGNRAGFYGIFFYVKKKIKSKLQK